MSKVEEIKLLPPQIPAELEDLDFEDREIEYEDHFNMSKISDCYIEEQRAEKVIFEKTVFENVIFNDISFKGLEIGRAHV